VFNPLTALVGIVIAAIIGTQTLATQIGPIGGNGDHESHDTCPAGSYIVGYLSGEGDWVDRVQPVCAPFDATSRTMGEPFRLDARGGPGGIAGSAMCTVRPNSVAVAIRYALSLSPTRVLGLNLQCRSVEGGKIFTVCAHPSGGRCELFSDEDWYNYFPCPANEAANGIFTRYGRDVNALGINCAAAPWTTAATPAPPLRQQSIGGGGIGGDTTCQGRGELRTLSDGPAVVIQFHNNGASARLLNWIDPQGRSLLYATIAPGATANQPTFGGHFWELTDPVGGCTMVFQAGNNNQTVEVP